jgi:hypothetical protein
VDGQCLVCGSGVDVRGHAVTLPDGTTRTVSLCASHHEFVRRGTPVGADAGPGPGAGRDDGFGSAETRKVTVRVPAALLEDVDERASELEVPRSELIRDCLREGLFAADADAEPEDFLVALVEASRDVERLRADLAGLADAGADADQTDDADATPDAATNGRTVAAVDADADADVGTDAPAPAPAPAPAADVEFLRERVVRLESLLELALERR